MVGPAEEQVRLEGGTGRHKSPPPDLQSTANIKTPACKNKNFANKNKNFATPTSKNWLISWKLYVSVPLAKYYSLLSMHWATKKQILPANARNSTAQDQRKSSSMFGGNRLLLDSDIQSDPNIDKQIPYISTYKTCCPNRNLGRSSGLHTHRRGVP